MSIYKNPLELANALGDEKEQYMIYGSPAREDYLKEQWDVYKQDPNAYESKVNPDIYSVIRRFGKSVEPDHPIHKRPLLPF